MPVLINSSTGLAENIPQQVADQAVQSGSHQLPLVDDQGKVVSAALPDAQNFVSQGYSQPSQSQLRAMMKYAHFNSTEQQLKTLAEGAAEGATFGLSSAAETMLLGVNPEDIRNRAEANPGMHVAGQGLGLAASSLIPIAGEANLIRAAGEGVAGVVGLGEGANLLSKIGSAAVKSAVETALVTGGDEVSKMITLDPDQTAGTAMANIGLSAVLGGALGAGFGTVSPLWKAANESKVGKLLNVITKKANGLEKDVLPDMSFEAIAKENGIQLNPEVNAYLSANPEVRELGNKLRESSTRSGTQFQESLNQVRSGANDALLRALGKTPEDIDALSQLSDYDVGLKIKDSLKREIKEKYDPISQMFDNVRSKYSTAEISNSEKVDIANNLAKFSQGQGYALMKGSPQQGIINKVIESLPNVKTLEEFRNFQSQVSDMTSSPEMWNLGKGLRRILRDTEEDVVANRLALENPTLMGEHQSARAGYRELMSTIDDINDRLRVGKYSGTESFLKNLSEMAPEDVLKRLTPKEDAGLIKVFQEKFPETMEKVKEKYINNMLEASTKRVAQGEVINPKALENHISSMSPELKSFLFPGDTLERVGAIQSLLESIPARPNPSGTAKMLDSLWSKAPGGALAMVEMIMHGNPLFGYVIGQLGRYVSREVPDAMTLSTLKFLGSELPQNSSAFKAMADFIVNGYRGNQKINNAVKAVFKSGALVLPQSMEPKEKQKAKLETAIADIGKDPNKLINMGGDIGYYLPNHAGSLSKAAMSAINHLNAMKPKIGPVGLLEKDPPANAVEQSKYDRALSIAEQPLTALKHVKDGTITPEDVGTMKAIYPGLHASLSQKLINAAVEHSAKGGIIPYKTKLALSMFTGEPLDSTLRQPNIMALQMNHAMPNQSQNQQTAELRKSGSMKELNKFAMSHQTQTQKAEARHISNA